MKKPVYSKKRAVFITLSFIFICLTIIGTLVTNNNIKHLMITRDTRLDVYEHTKIWVMDDIRSYLTVTKKTYNETKSSVHMTEDLKLKLFGATFVSSKFLNSQDISFIDAQYTVDSTKKITYYISCNVVVGEQVKRLQLLVFVDNNSIYNIIAY